MDTNQDKQAEPEIIPLADLKKVDLDKVTAQAAESVKGGRARRGGDDDDLEELQVQY